MGVGPATKIPAGATGLVAPKRVISGKFEEAKLDGVLVVCPELRTLFVADMIFPRGSRCQTARCAMIASSHPPAISGTDARSFSV